MKEILTSTTHASRTSSGGAVYDSEAIVRAYRLRRATRRAVPAPVKEPSAADRQHAWADPVRAGVALGRQLQRHLAAEALTGPVLVLALPAHGMQVAAAAAAVLDAELDVVVTRALRVGTEAEPALVAVAAAGARVHLVRPRPVSAEEAATAFEDSWAASITDLVREEAQWRADSPARQLAGRTVIVAVDVLDHANAPQVRGALEAVRRHGAARVVVAACASTLAPDLRLLGDADAVVCALTSLHGH